MSAVAYCQQLRCHIVVEERYQHGPGSFTGFIGLLDRVWISSFRSEVQAAMVESWKTEFTGAPDQGAPNSSAPAVVR
jgi:hypothetical protein